MLVGGALTNRPYFKGMKAVALSEYTLIKMSNLEDILKKEPTDLTDEEKDELKDNSDKLTDEQKEAFKDVLTEGEEGEEEEEG